MIPLLFDKDQPKICAFCFYGQDYGQDAILCSKKGPVGLQDHCKKYKYDPLKRQPKRQIVGDNYSPEDFSIK